MSSNLSAAFIPSSSSSSSKYGNNSFNKTKLFLQSLKGKNNNSGSGGNSNKARASFGDDPSLSNQQSLPALTVNAVKAPLSPRKSQSQQQPSSPGPQRLLGTSMDDSSLLLHLEESRDRGEDGSGKLRMSLDALPLDSSASSSLTKKLLPSEKSTKNFLFPDINNSRGIPPLPFSNEDGVGGVMIPLSENSKNTSKKPSKKMRSNNTNSKDRTYRYKIFPGNNSRVIMTAMKKRPWWHAILAKTEEEIPSGSNNTVTSANSEEDELLQYQPSFIWEMYRNSLRYKRPQLYKNILLNHIQKNAHLVTKKGLYLSIKSYCQQNHLDMLSIIPLSFYLAPKEFSKSMKDDDLQEFQSFCEKHSQEFHCHVNEINFIMKPASKTNRGFGIKVVKGMTKVLNIVQRGMSASSSNGLDAGEQEYISKNCSLENSFSADESLDGGGSVVIIGEEGTQPRASSMKENVQLAASPTSHKREKAKKSSKTTSSVMTNTTNSNSNPIIDAQENNPLSKAAKKIAQQDGYIVQLYLNSPLLIHGRKFDIRCFVLATVTPSPDKTNPEKVVKAYFFQEAYIRTSSKRYNLTNLYDREVHLTNDAVQKHSTSYGKYESGNKLSLFEWQEIINHDFAKGEGNAERPNDDRPTNNIVFDYIFPEMKRLSKLSIAAVAKAFQSTEIPKSFELFGYDYMILTNFQPVLIEVNTNPCLEFVNPLLTNIITTVIEHTIRMTVDKECPPPSRNHRTKSSEEAIQLIESEPLKFEPLYP